MHRPIAMVRFQRRPQPARIRRSGLFPAMAALFLAAAATAIPQTATQVLDASALHPPAGARVAIVEFADLQCPACAAANPILKGAAAKYKIPWIRHDFLIPIHNWSRAAAINARWFDQKSNALGDEYRDQLFANQASVYSPDSLRQFTSQFAQNHGIALPFALDPQGKLANDVIADNAIGQRTGIKGTPAIFIVTANSKGAPFIEVLKPAQQLYTIIDQALADTAPAPRLAAGKRATGK